MKNNQQIESLNPVVTTESVVTIPANVAPINGIALPTLADCKRMSKANGGKGLASNEGKATLYHGYNVVKSMFDGNKPEPAHVSAVCACLASVAGAESPISISYLLHGMTMVSLPTKANGLEKPVVTLKAPSRLKALVKAWGDSNGQVNWKTPDINTPRLSAPKAERKPSKEEMKVKSMGEEDLAKWKARQVAVFLKRMGWVENDPSVTKAFVADMFTAKAQDNAQG